MKCKEIVILFGKFIIALQATFLCLIEANGADPLPGSFLDKSSLTVNGETWTFLTPPPPLEERTVISSHPRLYFTKATLPALKAKLADPVYAADMVELKRLADSGNGIANALLYQIEGDVSRGTVAKNWLLSGAFGKVNGLSSSGSMVQPVLAFDWIMPLLSDTEKKDIFNLVKANFGYDHKVIESLFPGDARTAGWYNNNVYAYYPPLHYPILALAVAGDGIDDTWAQEVLDIAYDGESVMVRGPYGAKKGAGFLDALNSLSLDDGGGAQVGSFGYLAGGYYAMFLHSFMPIGAWESATGQPMWARCNYFRKLPIYWAYDKKNTPTEMGYAILEFITGLYKDIEPDAAALARWMINKWKRSNYFLVERLVFGDLRVIPKSPQELGLPPAKYIRGSDLFVSSRSWDENAVTLSTYSRYLDTSRYEPGSGLFAIYRGQEPLAVPSEPLKIGLRKGYYSGLWIYDPNDVKGSIIPNSTFWSGPRSLDAYTSVSNPEYFTGGPALEINNTYRAISTEYAKQFAVTGVRTARQTIIHIMDTDRDFIVVYDYSDVATNTNVKRAWSMRLATIPDIQGNKFSIPGGMHTTIVGPAEHSIAWVGGVGEELNGPPPEKAWYGHKLLPGYSTDPSKAKRYGIGNLFVQAKNDTEQLEFLIVNEVTDKAPMTVTRVSDSQVKFGKWDVSFSKNGATTVKNSEGDDLPPAPPLNLNIEQ